MKRICLNRVEIVVEKVGRQCPGLKWGRDYIEGSSIPPLFLTHKDLCMLSFMAHENVTRSHNGEATPPPPFLQRWQALCETNVDVKFYWHKQQATYEISIGYITCIGTNASCLAKINLVNIICIGTDSALRMQQ